MKKLQLFILLVWFGMLVSCNPNRVFKEYKSDFPKYKWNKVNEAVFMVDIDDVGVDYKVFLGLRHVYGFQMRSIPVRAFIAGPDIKMEDKPYEIVVFGLDQKYLSECSGDYCDLQTMVEDHFKFPKPGRYTFTLVQDSELNPVPNVMEVGLIIEKNETMESVAFQ